MQNIMKFHTKAAVSLRKRTIEMPKVIRFKSTNIDPNAEIPVLFKDNPSKPTMVSSSFAGSKSRYAVG